MHIAYSALTQLNETHQIAPPNAESTLMIRYKAYLATCEKFNREIVAIQKHLPNWQPTFNY